MEPVLWTNPSLWPRSVTRFSRIVLGVTVLVVLAGCASDPDSRPVAGPALKSPELAAGSPVPSTATTTLPTATSTTTATTTTTTTLPPLVLGFAGDTSFTHGLASYDPLGEVEEFLTTPDLMLVNLETTIAEAGVGTAYAKKYTFRSPPESTDLLLAAGIDGVALANNHMLDFGQAALRRTLELLDQTGVKRAGAGADKSEAYAPMMFEAAGRTVAVLSVSRVLSQPSWAADTERPGIASAYEDWIPETMEAVEKAAQEADFVVVMVHWGIELHYCPEQHQRDIARSWVEAGADLIVGSHPHVLQGVERIEEAWVLYSTGNFAFPSARSLSDDSAVFEITVAQNGTKLTARPVHIIGGRPHPATEQQAAEILEVLSDHSFGWMFDEAGVATRTDQPSRCP